MKKHSALTPLLVGGLTVAMWAGSSGTAAAQANLVQIENAKAGATDWLLTKVKRHDDEIYELGWHRRKGIEAYASHTSVKAGETLNVHVSTSPVNKYSVGIYRMGYYGGAGARLMRSLGPLQGTAEPDSEGRSAQSARVQLEGGLQSGDSGGLVERRLHRKALHASCAPTGSSSIWR